MRGRPLLGDKPPEHIYLPDGRQFTVADLLKSVKDRKTFQFKKSKYGPGRPTVYTPEFREWMTTATIEEVMDKLNCDKRYARVQIKNSHAFMLGRRQT
jgi:hypothetical protein